MPHWQVVEGSGFGWDHFDVRTAGVKNNQEMNGSSSSKSSKNSFEVDRSSNSRPNQDQIPGLTEKNGNDSSQNGSVGQLYVIKNLDYENEAHRRGFRFLVEVTDRVSGKIINSWER